MHTLPRLFQVFVVLMRCHVILLSFHQQKRFTINVIQTWVWTHSHRGFYLRTIINNIILCIYGHPSLWEWSNTFTRIYVCLPFNNKYQLIISSLPECLILLTRLRKPQVFHLPLVRVKDVFDSVALVWTKGGSQWLSSCPAAPNPVPGNRPATGE